jgi:mono/diheme cytochrome c family protein
MKRILITTAGSLALALLTFAALPSNDSAPARPASPAADPALILRGNYLVNQVGLCVDCHSPRDEKGAFLQGKHLLGSPVAFAPTVPVPAWASAASPIAGLPAGWTKEAAMHFLMTGERPFNLPPVRPPMPPYRFSQDDARAVVAYLHSLRNAAP